MTLTPHDVPCGRWYSVYAAFTALATLGLIALGGLVTSHGAGMAVPDWPTTYGYNMFLFPISKWVGGIFYEHTHRLYASAVGLLTVILAVWAQLLARASRGREPRLTTVARLSWVALGLVVVQGVLGGLRVNLMQDEIGIVHAALAQVFWVLLAILALVASPWWRRWRQISGGARDWKRALSAYRWVVAATVVIFAQLLLGAAMRHQHAGLAVPDFPMAYGQVWPPTDEAFLQRANALRTDWRGFNPITAHQIHLHMAHRLTALAIVVLVWVAARRLGRAFAGLAPARLGWAWVGLVGAQIVAGAMTIWSNKAADIATLHVVIGACCLSVGVLTAAICRVALSGEAAASRVEPPTVSEGADLSPARA
jgi:cytochrome c oxidase assembly protein subunit 15